MWLNDRAEDLIEWCEDNLMAGCLVLLGVLLAGGGVALCWYTWSHRNDPITIEQVAAKQHYVETVWVMQGKVMTPIPVDRFVFHTAAGHRCETDAATFAARKEGEMEPCRWK